MYQVPRMVPVMWSWKYYMLRDWWYGTNVSFAFTSCCFFGTAVCSSLLRCACLFCRTQARKKREALFFYVRSPSAEIKEGGGLNVHLVECVRAYIHAYVHRISWPPAALRPTCCAKPSGTYTLLTWYMYTTDDDRSVRIPVQHVQRLSGTSYCSVALPSFLWQISGQTLLVCTDHVSRCG